MCLQSFLSQGGIRPAILKMVRSMPPSSTGLPAQQHVATQHMQLFGPASVLLLLWWGKASLWLSPIGSRTCWQNFLPQIQWSTRAAVSGVVAPMTSSSTKLADSTRQR